MPLKRVTATGDVATAGSYLQSVVLTPAAAVATLDVRVDGSGGTVVMSLQAAANGSSVVWQARSRGAGLGAAGLHATLAGAGASATFEYA